MQEALIAEERIEIQNFAVLDVRRVRVKRPNTLTTFDGKRTQMPSERVCWVFKPSKKLRHAVKK